MTSTRIDVVSIFPDYLAPVRLSLLGRAQADRKLSVRVHDLRDSTHDRHRTVDDTPYGGGAGMVMRPEPWGEALDRLLDTDAPAGTRPTLVVPTPAGAIFTQALAAELASRPWLIIACGRYEGIDQRVIEHYEGRVDVVELSIGDYVLNGGEAAALVVIEAVARLLPGFMGNPDSLIEESHGLGGTADLLEYPVYTKPPVWRGLEVPPVLLSGHHGDIAAWRRSAAVRRTAQRRPDLAHPSTGLTLTDASTVDVRLARPADVPELLVLQRCCWVGEAQLNDELFLPALTESLDDVRAAFETWQTYVAVSGGRLVGAVRGRLADDDHGGSRWDIGRLMVAPDLAGRGLGRLLLAHIEAAAPAAATTYQLFTGPASVRNLRMYRRAGYRRVPTPGQDDVVTLRKSVPRRALPR